MKTNKSNIKAENRNHSYNELTDNKDEFEKLLDDFPKISQNDLSISNSDIEKALAKVHRQTYKESTERESNTARIFSYFAAAAIILLGFGIGYYNFGIKTITAPFGEIAHVTLNDGSVLEMNSGSSINYRPFFGVFHRNIQMEGEIFFNIYPSDTPFTITTSFSKVKVLGTSFNIRSWSTEPENGTLLTVVSGSVEFSALDTSQSIILEAGNTQKWNPFNEIFENLNYSISDRYTAWRSNILTFNNQSLRSIINQLERTYNIEIEVSDKIPSHTQLSLLYMEEVPIDVVLNDISTVKGLNFTRTSTGYRITPK